MTLSIVLIGFVLFVIFGLGFASGILFERKHAARIQAGIEKVQSAVETVKDI